MYKANFIFSIIILSTLSIASFADKIKMDVKTDTIAIRGMEWNIEYFVDKKAKICLAMRNPGAHVMMATISCDELIKGYPDLKAKVDWQ